MSIAGKLVAGLVSLLLFSMAPCHGQADDNGKNQVIKIGALNDARPFVWLDETTQHYLGFLWAVCTEAVHRAGYQYEATTVTSEMRSDFLETGKGDYDLLCDPTTITIERMRNFEDDGKARDLSFSPIVFVANSSFMEQAQGGTRIGEGGYISSPRTSTCNEVLDKQKKNEEAKAKTSDGVKTNDGAAANEARNYWYDRLFQNLTVTMRRPDMSKVPDVDYQIWGYVDGTTIGDILHRSYPRPEEKQICLKPFASYKEAAEEFCKGRLSRFFGDVDIIKAALDDYRGRADVKCPANLSSTTNGAYEPYAFVLSSKSVAAFPERFTLALYGMFEDGTIERFFKGHFPDNTQKSQYLSTLFAINSIPAGVRPAAVNPVDGP
ncbi:transporter substrate-binding domain-containing protein [Rhizobium laguerreae]|uniref:transporter substrate-binding domain-containing protein n=1 Tax=Rhizobium laguerreae TaxID=1076926 RepID=UPI001C921328|nr:transporter substrate-binding domain-containing protein [Rhizobium laguerreae]MBY3158033.1 transporter substrate-binding domain-containing protein [Rhizobium laguerreae]MBY3447022.1 transporter substrate-binding domain-containing protein [Rhizobium laguerreae]